MPSPMPEQDDDREGAVVEAAQGANMSENQAHLLASAANAGSVLQTNWTT